MQLSSFVTGLVAGAALMYGSITHHLLRTNEGLTLVPKLQPSLAETYLDVRTFGISDWSRHPAVAAAIVRSGKQQLFAQHAEPTIRDQVQDFLQAWGGKPSQTR